MEKKCGNVVGLKESVFISNGSSHKPICFPDLDDRIIFDTRNLDVIMPRISTVRNEGWDNSGLSCKYQMGRYCSKAYFASNRRKF